MSQKKLLITNVVFGDRYPEVFCNYHLKSLLHSLEDFTDRVEYAIFTNDQTYEYLAQNEQYKILSTNIPVNLVKFTETNQNLYESRYGMLRNTFKMSMKLALGKDAYVSPIVADLVFADDFLHKIFRRLDEGYDSVFGLPMRTAYESLAQHLKDGALPAECLGGLGYQHLHPLWNACHWEAAQFTKMPFSLLWNTGTGLVAHSFSITPIAFTPTEDMLRPLMIDVEIPGMCPNPYFPEDWTEVPVLGLEFLHCHYPPFGNHKASVEQVAQFASKALDKTQYPLLEKRLYYPSREIAGEYHNPGPDNVVSAILKRVDQLSEANAENSQPA